ncbi:hypothetical protein FXB38_09765 [Bradyrhizobium cytisi]|uniref:Nitroreductase domain-containing protein n=1 Tax=Bradyrhizobium cytisi TaxID=515489 RepID=A0A5S4X0C1_9BRAD|nr:hypothetical protein FXB38_09765 [Bradyrhizobium cytisi]
MRKYGRRGYLYHLLDIGHAALNLSLVAGDSPVSRWVLQSRVAQQIARQSSACGGSLLGVGIIEGGRNQVSPTGWTMHDTTDASTLALSDIEGVVGSFLPPPPEPVALYLAKGCAQTDLANAIANRRSAARLQGLVSPDPAARATQRCVDLCERLIPALGLPVPGILSISRNQENGARRLNPTWTDRALIGQSDLAGANTFIVIHSKIRDAVADTLTPSTQRLIVACGIAGEIAYLTATHAGLGVTGIGGINPSLWAELCETSDDVLYLVALGDSQVGEKFDATGTRGSHG